MFTRVVGVIKQINVGCLRADEVLFVPGQQVSRLKRAVFRLTLRLLEVTCGVAAVCKKSAVTVKSGVGIVCAFRQSYAFSKLSQ